MSFSRFCSKRLDQSWVSSHKWRPEERTTRQNAGQFLPKRMIRCLSILTKPSLGCPDEAGGGSQDRRDAHPRQRHGAAHQDHGPGRRGGWGDNSLNKVTPPCDSWVKQTETVLPFQMDPCYLDVNGCERLGSRRGFYWKFWVNSNQWGGGDGSNHRRGEDNILDPYLSCKSIIW